MLRRKKLGQSTAEYAIVIGLVIAAAVAMQIYVKRGIQGKIKGTVDFRPDTTIFQGKQYEPDYSASDMDSTGHTKGTTATNANGEVVRTITSGGDRNERWGNQTTVGLDANGNPL